MPKADLTIGVMRHGETWDNIIQRLPIYDQKRYGEPQWVSKFDPHLSDNGYVQMYHASKVVYRELGKPDVVARSQKMRTRESLEVLINTEKKLEPRLLHIIDHDLEELRHWPKYFNQDAAERWNTLRQALDAMVNENRNGARLLPAQVPSIIKRDLVEWRLSQLELPIYERRKMPGGENFLDLQERIASTLQITIQRGIDEGADSFLFMVHGKVCLAIQSLFEKWSLEKLSEVLKTEGEPFPPNSGLMVYEKRGGRIKPKTKGWTLSEVLSRQGREVGLRADAEPHIKQHVEAINSFSAYALERRPTQSRRVCFEGRVSVFPINIFRQSMDLAALQGEITDDAMYA